MALPPGSTTLAKYAITKLSEYANRNTEALREADAAEARTWVHQRFKAMREQLDRLEQQASDAIELRRRFDQLVADTQFHRVERNYEFEAVREATDERRRMLAFASAGSVNVDLTVAQLARVERTLRELDPTDAQLLYALAAQGEQDEPSEPNEISVLGRARYLTMQDNQPSGHILTASACVTLRTPDTWGSHPEAHVTALGLWVLDVLAPYFLANKGDD